MLYDDAVLTDTYGIRNFFGLSQNNEIKFNKEWYEEMLELEAEAGQIEGYKKIANFNHLIFEKRYATV